MKLVTLLIPCYNEEKNIALLCNELKKLRDLRVAVEVLFVDDGSKDNTWLEIRSAKNVLSDWAAYVRAARFTRNFGKESAILAGLELALGEAVIFMDADLQDPPYLIHSLIAKWQEGNYKIVSAVRERREDTAIKVVTAHLFYWVFKRLSRLDIVENSSDFRLIDKDIARLMLECKEKVRFTKALFAWTGYESAVIYYKRAKRVGGKTKWGYWRLWNYALDGIFSTSTLPLRIWSYIGLLMMIGTTGFFVVSMCRYYSGGDTPPGYISLIAAVVFLGAVQIAGIGLIGEYLGRVYLETRERPQYIIRETVD